MGTVGRKQFGPSRVFIDLPDDLLKNYDHCCAAMRYATQIFSSAYYRLYVE